jgi:hypothetical protein
MPQVLSTRKLLASGSTPNWTRDFPVVGQGTIIFSIQRESAFSIVIRPKLKEGDPGADQWISLEVHEDTANFKIGQDQKREVLTEVTGVVKNERVGYEPGRQISYWFSYDRDRLVLKYGKGYRMEETTLMTYDFLNPDGKPVDNPDQVRKDLQYLFSPTIRRRIEQYDISSQEEMIKLYSARIKKSGIFHGAQLAKMFKGVSVAQEDAKILEMAKSIINIDGEVAFDKEPLVANWSPIILDSSKVSLQALDNNEYTFSASLPMACQELYQNVSAEHVDLNYPPTHDDLNLSDAIRYSMTTEGMCLYEKLQEKKGEFGPENEVYLRITLGPNRGSAPGVPYVLEIWPKGCGSPIHTHGNACAVIKVLHGGLTISIFNKHVESNDTPPLRQFDVHKGDLTWISPNWYQMHKLWNHTNDYCATVQCYKYGVVDYHYWPYFDMPVENQEFLPNSDFTYEDMRTKVMAEYRASLHLLPKM